MESKDLVVLTYHESWKPILQNILDDSSATAPTENDRKDAARLYDLISKQAEEGNDANGERCETISLTPKDASSLIWILMVQIERNTNIFD